MHRMVSIDLNAPTATPSLPTSGMYHQPKCGLATPGGSLTKNLGLRSLDDESLIYEKYFHRRIVRLASILNLLLAVLILTCQLSTTGLLIGPIASASGPALSTSDRIGLGIWSAITSTLAAGATFWAMNKTNFCRLHASMLLHFGSWIVHIVLLCFLLLNTIPHIQERIYFLQVNMADVTAPTLETRRVLLVTKSFENDSQIKEKAQIHLQAELNRLYAALVLSIIMALSGILQILINFLMNLKTGRAICLGKTYYEGKFLQLQTFGRSWRDKSFRLGSKNGTMNLPKLERSDALPPPPYESGYFHPSLSA